MFILRKLVPRHGIENAYSETNTIIGESYQVASPLEIEELIQSDDYYKSVQESIYGFITYENGSKTLPLYRKQKNYMMTDTGNTFANLSER